MKTFLAPLTALLVAAPLLAQDSIQYTKYRYEKALKRIAGVLDVSVGGVNGDLKIIVRVDSEDAKETVALLTGSKLEGFPVQILKSTTTTTEPPPAPVKADCPDCGCPCHKQRVGQTVTEPPKVAADDPDCDIRLEMMGKKVKRAVNCIQMVGWTTDPKRIAWVKSQGLPHGESKEMMGGIAYTYIKHRASCPYGQKQVERLIEEMTTDK